MIEFRGTYFDGKSSRAQPVIVRFDGTFLYVRGDSLPAGMDLSPKDVVISPPLGQTSRALKLPNGARIETDDFASVEALEQRKGGNIGLRVVHALESRWKAVAGCMIGLAVFIWLFASYGIPLLAERVAGSIPPKVMEKISSETLKALDEQFLEPSCLPPDRSVKVSELFRQITAEGGTESDYRLEFRKTKGKHANAFALPSGILIVTDELVALAKSDRELVGVLAHEMAHVKKRHALRNILQTSGVFLLVSVMVGDVGSVSSIIASLPLLLIETGYSRTFEREADMEAGLYLISKGWTTKPYQDMLLRLSKDVPGSAGIPALSTHPQTQERIKYLQELERSGGP
jgi:Zn-dependent protease with chaperone function